MINRVRSFAYRAVVVVSFAAFLISCALCIVGYKRFLSATVTMPGADFRHDVDKYLYITLECGVATVQCREIVKPIFDFDNEQRQRDGVPDLDSFRIEAGGNDDPTSLPRQLDHYLGGFGYELTQEGSGKDELLVEVPPRIVPIRDLTIGCQAPLWFVVLSTALIPVKWGRARLKLARRRRDGLCLVCGYDMRASPSICPECGNMATERLPKRKVRLRSLAVWSSGLMMAFATCLWVVSHWREADFHLDVGTSSAHDKSSAGIYCEFRRDIVMASLLLNRTPIKIPDEKVQTPSDDPGSWAAMVFEWAKESRYLTGPLPSRFRAGFEHYHRMQQFALPKFADGPRDRRSYYIHFPLWTAAIVGAMLPGIKLCQRLRSILSRRK